MKKVVSVLIATAMTSGLWAHPGHGHGNPLNPGHFVTTPEHAMQLTLAIATGVILINWLVSKLSRKSQKN